MCFRSLSKKPVSPFLPFIRLVTSFLWAFNICFSSDFISSLPLWDACSVNDGKGTPECCLGFIFALYYSLKIEEGRILQNKKDRDHRKSPKWWFFVISACELFLSSSRVTIMGLLLFIVSRFPDNFSILDPAPASWFYHKSHYWWLSDWPVQQLRTSRNDFHLEGVLGHSQDNHQYQTNYSSWQDVVCKTENLHKMFHLSSFNPSSVGSRFSIK